jgi:hypothetical protein
MSTNLMLEHLMLVKVVLLNSVVLRNNFSLVRIRFGVMMNQVVLVLFCRKQKYVIRLIVWRAMSLFVSDYSFFFLYLLAKDAVTSKKTSVAADNSDDDENDARPAMILDDEDVVATTAAPVKPVAVAPQKRVEIEQDDGGFSFDNDDDDGFGMAAGDNDGFGIDDDSDDDGDAPNPLMLEDEDLDGPEQVKRCIAVVRIANCVDCLRGLCRSLFSPVRCANDRCRPSLLSRIVAKILKC